MSSFANPEYATKRASLRGNTLRKGRFSQIGDRYHTTFATRDRRPFFEDFEAARSVICALRASDQIGVTQTLAFVVMPDHVHWLFELSAGTLAQAIARVNSQVSRTQRARQSVWQSGYHDHAVRRDEEIEKFARYVVENPIRAGLVVDVANYSHWDLDGM